MEANQFFKCLADDTRLKCVLLIDYEHELCVCDLVDALGESQPKISRHLAQLRTFGLLQDRRVSHWVYYRINPQLPDWSRKIISFTRESRACELDAALGHLRLSERRLC